ncbi:MAG: proton-conducting transporter membrane subunit [Gammaproteobacteria bacterium]|nr:proton-conducting transporter membrane subunit [Gammaproteobacteria bacterium]
MASWIWLVPLLPLTAAFVIGIGYITGFNRGEKGENQTSFLAVGASAASLLIMLTLDVLALTHEQEEHVVLGNWLRSGDYLIDISFMLDRLSLAFGSLVALISFLTTKFSVNYLHREAGYQRFFIILSLFNGAMLLIVLAGNAALTFVGWELAGVSSYLLIAYAYDRNTATINANRAFITNRIGDAGFILGLFLCFLWLGNTEWTTLQEAGPTLSVLTADIIIVSFLLAALTKSALVPFSGWIARALEGPTPSSSIFYGSLMIHAGVYLLLRLQPVLEQTPVFMVALVVIGLVTALYGYLTGLVQTDVKSALIFSTNAQVGLMFMEIGLGLFSLATLHMLFHAAWRAYQFLHAPMLMHAVSRPARKAPKWLIGNQRLYNAAIQRFWLDSLGDGFLVRPVKLLACELIIFDERVVNRLVGLPGRASAISSVAEWEQRKAGSIKLPDGDVGRGAGAIGKFMEWVATRFQWFEEHLVLKGSGEGLLSLLRHIGSYLLIIEQLLSQPRYLWLMILVTFAVVI